MSEKIFSLIEFYLSIYLRKGVPFVEKNILGKKLGGVGNLMK